MKPNLKDRKRKILRKIYGALSLSTALFVFQACYGPRIDEGKDVYFQGLVKSKSTNLPIPGIKVSIENQPQYIFTDNQGSFRIYAATALEYKLKFEDIDSTTNGYFLPKDTLLKTDDKSAFLNILLDVL
jgi:hypothetical protein